MQDHLKPFRAWTPAAVTGCFSPADFRFLSFSASEFCFVPVKQRALGQRLAGGDFDQAVNEMRATWPGTLSIVIGPTYGLTRLRSRCPGAFALLRLGVYSGSYAPNQLCSMGMYGYIVAHELSDAGS
jgi:hypothetical protein